MRLDLFFVVFVGCFISIMAIMIPAVASADWADDVKEILLLRAEHSVNEPEQISIDISGEWIGHLLLDGLGNERTSDSNYVFNIVQNNNSLTASLDIPDEFGFISPIYFSGEIENDSTLTMTGTHDGTELKIYGTVKDDHSLEVAIDGIEQEIQFVIMYKEEDLLTGSYSNTYKLELKLGEIGTGRSIILVHGMNDNAKSWNEMLDYFDDHGIDTTNNVWVFEYTWWSHITYNGIEMETMISDKQAEGKITQDPIIIAHSMGGLVSRSYIAHGGNFYRLVTLSTPHLGSKLAHFVPFGNTDGVGDLIPGHDFLNNLNSCRYEKTQRSKYWLLNGRVGTYRSCYHWHHPTCYHWHHPTPTHIEKIGHGKLQKPNDGMVTNASARFTGNKYYEKDNNVHRVNTFEWIDHKNLNKDHRVCLWVKDFINDHQ
jgi:triacylglycerol esterase/lipase EstA (alpha/beta hydrolase family)